MLHRRPFKQLSTLEDRLAEEAINLRKQAEGMPSSVLTLNCPTITHAASTLSSAARARLIFSRIPAPSAFQVYGFGAALRSER